MKNVYVVFYKNTNKIHSYTYNKSVLNNLNCEFLEYCKFKNSHTIKSILCKDICDVLDNDYFRETASINEINDFEESTNINISELHADVNDLCNLVNASYSEVLYDTVDELYRRIDGNIGESLYDTLINLNVDSQILFEDYLRKSRGYKISKLEEEDVCNVL